MENREASSENSSTEQDRRRERHRRPLPSTEGSGRESFPGGGSSATSSPQVGQDNRSSIRATEEMRRSSLPVVAPSNPRPPPTRIVIVPARANPGKGVAKESLAANGQEQTSGWMAGGSKKRESEFISRALSSSWTVTEPNKHKRRGQLKEIPTQQPRCSTCGKDYGSWKALFGHLRSHPERDYRGAFPPPKASNVDPLVGRGIDPRQQRELMMSLINAATVVSSLLDDEESGPEPEKAMQIGEASGARTSRSAPERPPSPSSGVPSVDPTAPGENRRSLRNDGLKLDLNLPPPPESDSDEEIPK